MKGEPVIAAGSEVKKAHRYNQKVPLSKVILGMSPYIFWIFEDDGENCILFNYFRIPRGTWYTQERF